MTITLPVAIRGAETKNAALRALGQVPGIVYGPKQPTINVSVDMKVFSKVLGEAGESAIISLTGLEHDVEVLVKEVDFDPVKRSYRHVDFYAIERGKDMTVTVPLEFIGQAPAEKNGIGSVNKALHEVTVTCRPSNLPQHIDIDVSGLEAIDQKITVGDIVVPKGVTIDNDASETVAVVSPNQEYVEAEPAQVDMAAIAVEEKGKTEAAS